MVKVITIEGDRYVIEYRKLVDVQLSRVFLITGEDVSETLDDYVLHMIEERLENE